MYSIQLLLSRPQIRRLAQGKAVQLKHADIHHPQGVHVALRQRQATKLHRAHLQGKGARLRIDPDQLGASGLLDWIKDAGRWIKDKIIDSDVYQKTLRPIAREAVNRGIQTASALAGPFSKEAQQVLQSGANYIGDRTGAFGLKSLGKRGLPNNPAPQMPPPGVPSMEPSRGRLVKGSAEAKEYMARLRAMKGGSFRR
jgi:hypothetical protein